MKHSQLQCIEDAIAEMPVIPTPSSPVGVATGNRSSPGGGGRSKSAAQSSSSNGAKGLSAVDESGRSGSTKPVTSATSIPSSTSSSTSSRTTAAPTIARHSVVHATSGTGHTGAGGVSTSGISDNETISSFGSAARPFSPSYYLSILSDGESVRSVPVYCKEDVHRAFEKTVQGLQRTDDWEARKNALMQLQGLAKGEGKTFEEFVRLVRTSHELVSDK